MRGVRAARRGLPHRHQLTRTRTARRRAPAGRRPLPGAARRGASAGVARCRRRAGHPLPGRGASVARPVGRDGAGVHPRHRGHRAGRARKGAGGERGSAPHPGALPEAGRRTDAGGGGRGDERPAPPRALRAPTTPSCRCAPRAAGPGRWTWWGRSASPPTCWPVRDAWCCPSRATLLAIRGAGAYGMSMASTYNGRPRPAEVLVSGRRARVIRRSASEWRTSGAARRPDGRVAGAMKLRRLDDRAGHAVPWRSAGRGRVPGAGPPAARRRHRGPGALRHHRRGGDHDRRGAGPGSPGGGRGGEGPRPRGRRRGQQQHAPRPSRRWDACARSAPTPRWSSRPTTTSRPRRGCSSTTAPREGAPGLPASWSTTCPAGRAGTCCRRRAAALRAGRDRRASRRPPRA